MIAVAAALYALRLPLMAFSTNFIVRVLSGTIFDEQLIGEVIMLAVPLLLAGWLAGLLWEIAAALLVFCVCKWAYQVKGYFHKPEGKEYLCIIITYTKFLGIGVLCSGLATLSWVFTNQPLLSVLLALITTYFYALLSDRQANDRIVTEKLRQAESKIQALEAKPPFKCETASEEALRLRGLVCGLDDKAIDFIIKAHRIKYYRKPLMGFYEADDTPEKVKERKRRLVRLLESGEKPG